MIQTEVGCAYEEIVWQYLKKELRRNRLPFSTRNSSLFLHKIYPTYCNSRVETDITIESFRRGSPGRALLTIVECKNMRREVGTLQVNDLTTKLRLLKANKGIIAFRGRITDGAFKQARNQGIALLYLDIDKKAQWILP